MSLGFCSALICGRDDLSAVVDNVECMDMLLLGGSFGIGVSVEVGSQLFEFLGKNYLHYRKQNSMANSSTMIA